MAKTELEAAGEDVSGMAESTATLRAEIKALSGVDIMLNENTFKSSYQIMDELSQKWEDLSDISQATITELLAGKHQGNTMSSLMENFDIARQALDTSLNSSGSAMREHERWSQSLEARLLSLKASWQFLSQSFLQSDFLKVALNSVIALVDGVTKLIDTFGTLPTLITAFSAYKAVMGQSFFKPIEDESKTFAQNLAQTLAKPFKEVGSLAKSIFSESVTFSFDTNFESTLASDKIALESYIAQLRAGVPVEEAFAATMREASVEAQNYARTMNTATMSTEGFEASAKQSQITEMASSFRNAGALIREYNGGLKTCNLSQSQFIDAVGKGNANLGNYFSSVKQGSASMKGYVTSLIGAKAATIGLQIATTALNAVIGMGIGALVSAAISGVTTLINKLINAEEELAEKVDEVTTKYQEQHDSLRKLKGDYDTSNESSMISKYEKLSKGVNNLGENVSLTSEEYSEYQSIVNKIADQIPSLITGYDSQGNALLSVKGNVEELTKAYEKLIHAQNQEVLNNVGDINKDWKNKLEQATKYDFWELMGNSFSVDGIFGGSMDVWDMKTDTVEWLNSLTPDVSEKEILSYLNDNDDSGMAGAEIIQALQKAGYDVGFWTSRNKLSEVLHEALQNEPEKIKGIVDDYYAQFDEVINQYKTIAQAKLSEAFDISSAISGVNYSNIGENMQNIIRQTVNSLDFKSLRELTEKGISIEDWVTSMLDQLNSLDKEDSAKIETAFDLQTQFNGGEISYGEYVKGLENTGKLVDGLDIDDELKTDIKLSLGLDEDGLVEGYKVLKNKLANSDTFDIMPSEYRAFLDDLSSEEVSVAIDVITEFEETDYKEDINDLKTALKRELMLQSLSFTLNIETETAGIDALNTALTESVSASGLSSESITALKSRYAELESQGYDLTAMFEESSNGIHLNRQEYNKLEKAYAQQKLDKINGELAEMKSTYDEMGEELKTCSDEAKAGLYNDRLTLAQKIADAATLAAQYEGLTSAYNDWQAAEAAGQERDMYENIISGFENIDDELSRGWIDDGTIEFLELLSGKDLSGASIKQLKETYKGLDKEIKNTGYSVRDFFTVNEDGESTNTGVYNFLEAVEDVTGKVDVIKRDKDNNIIGFDFELFGGDKAIADALGISEELVQIMVRAADDAGFVVSLDGTYRQLADLQNEAKAAASTLKELGLTDYEFDFNTSSIKDLNEQLDEAHKILDNPDFWNKDGTFNYDVDGATEAMQVVSTLQAKLDNLTGEKYGIGLTVEDEEFEEPLEKLQTYGRKIVTLNQLELDPKANTKDIEQLEGELEDISKYFANLDKETKVKLGFDADDNWKEVQKKIENGEVTIPTVLDIQANMDKNIEKLVGLSMLNSGLYSEEEKKVIRQKYDLEIEVDEVDDSDVEDTISAYDPDFVGEPSTRQTNIKIIAQTFGVEDVDNLDSKLEGLDDKQIQAIVDVLGQIDVDKLKSTMATLEPKKVEAIAEAIGKGDVDGLKTAISQLSPKQVQAIAEALGYSDVNELNNAIDNLDPKVVQAVAQALGITDVNTLQNAIDNMQGNEVDAKVNTEGQADKVNSLQSIINSLVGKTVNVVVNTFKNVIETVSSGGKNKANQRTGADPAGNGITEGGSRSCVNGTANVNGTTGHAFKQGSWGTKNSGTALVGELGRELVRF